MSDASDSDMDMGTRVDLLDLPIELHLLVAAGLPPEDLLVLGTSCRPLVEICRADQLWRWHFHDLSQENPGVTVGRDPGDRKFEHYMKFRGHLEEQVAIAGAKMLYDFKSRTGKSRDLKNLSSLPAFGTITGEGTSYASFTLHGGRLPVQVPSAAALELLDLMRDVPKEKGVCVGNAAQKAACILNVSRSSLEALAKRAAPKRRHILLKLLREPFSMEYIPMAQAQDRRDDEVVDDRDDALVAEVLVADPANFTPRKLAMRRALQKQAGQIEELKSEMEQLETRAAAERDELLLSLASDQRELNRLRSRVSELEGESKVGLRAQLRAAKRQLADQVEIQAAMEKNARGIALQLQRARDDNVTDLVARRRAEN